MNLHLRLACTATVFFALAASASAANIVWVTFHSADNAPSANAATAGFTTAPDKGYTDLLTANGNTVTRFVTHDIASGGSLSSDELAQLNGADLVIIGRSINSGNYQQNEEALAWNVQVTAPLILMSGYVERANRLGYVTASVTPPDIAGNVKLTVNNPLHPIFAGIALDGTNTMINDFAGLAVSPVDGTTVQRGISVNTDPLAGGGTALATDGTVGDAAFGGTLIAEWPAGATLANATASVLGGHRLVFLSGSREANGVTGDSAGIYDLSGDGAQLFLNAVNYMAVPEPGTMVLAAFGALGLAGVYCSRRRSAG